jgi:hypothetical protein
MALETAQYINQLVSSNPLSTDTVAQADDHIRLIKSVLKSTFPNLTGAVTATQDQINSPLPSGGIIMWSGASVPSGWKLCDGTNSTPDLRNRFIIGASTTYPLGSSGGSTTTNASGSHTHSMNAAGSHVHGGSVGITALTIAQLPSHTHTYVEPAGAALEFGSGLTGFSGLAGAATGNTGATGSGEGHTHTVTADGGHVHTINSIGDHTHTITPPYYALAFIMKI